MEFVFDAASPLDGGKLLAWVAKDSMKVSFKPEGVLYVTLEVADRKMPVDAAIRLLDVLAGFQQPQHSGH
jgi:hypothetical protein